MLPHGLLNGRLGAGVGRSSLQSALRASLSAQKLLTGAGQVGKTHTNPRGTAPSGGSAGCGVNTKASGSVWQHWDSCVQPGSAKGSRPGKSAGRTAAHAEAAVTAAPSEEQPYVSEEFLRLEALIKQPLSTPLQPVPESCSQSEATTLSSTEPALETTTSPSSSESSAETDPVLPDVLAHFLLPPGLAGWVIGSRGVVLDKLRAQSQARLWLSAAGQHFAHCRVCYVQGPLDTTMEAVSLVLEHLLSSRSPLVKDYFYTKDGGMVKVRLIVPTWLVGTIIGTGAANVKRINQESGAYVRVITEVSSKAKMAEGADLYRMVHVAGSQQQVLAAIRGVLESIQRNPRYKPVWLQPDYKGKPVLI